MRKVNNQAKKVLDKMTKDLDGYGKQFKVEKENFDTLNVEKVSEVEIGPVFSVSLNFIQNGDLMDVPEIRFLMDKEGNYYPITYKMDGMVQLYPYELVCFNCNGQARGIRKRAQRQLAIDAGKLLLDIKKTYL